MLKDLISKSLERKERDRFGRSVPTDLIHKY